MLKNMSLRVKVHQTMLITHHGAHNNRELTGMLPTKSAIDTAHRLSVASMIPADTCLGSDAELPTIATVNGWYCYETVEQVCPRNHEAVFSLV